MNIIAIEKDAFESFKKILEQMASLAPKQSSNNTHLIEQEWIEGKELATSLNISLRHLQTLRENGKLSFSTIGKKVYYRIAEVKSLLEEHKISSK
ncbi:helix-turn-helix domain-containing protein [Dysgonomonas sp. BGC7]|uniref:helix-turn-helix domain-containing protein n=1 Tax=Dysgonomonas sp. BGC7 TaxID=1658008 RepID=UPI0006815D97|nr:helix-turn-helix domain-containing protein [Dysgonomonas sp. BGC7]MBD8387440.1 helix-turn-helix domain-containing protein [Dysgonomonas sp. BGC7]